MNLKQSGGDPTAWKHRPVMIKRSLGMVHPASSSEEKVAAVQALDIHQLPPEKSVVSIDNKYFTGIAYITIAGLPTTPAALFL